MEILRNREYFPDECVDLVYLDPPFNSNRNYNVLFKSESGADSEAQITAFEDTWHWGENAEGTYRNLITYAPEKVSTAIEALLNLIDRNQMMAYLVMMTARLVELRRVLKPAGSLYLHCDPTASHNLKIVLDAIFGPDNFRSEVVWKRTGSHSGAKRWGPIHDVIFVYSKSRNYIWNKIYIDYDQEYITKLFRHSDDRGRYGLVLLTGSGTRQGESGIPWRGVNPTESGRHWAVPSSSLQAAYPETDLSGLTVQEKLDLFE